jgi:hypothetical protein
MNARALCLAGIAALCAAWASPAPAQTAAAPEKDRCFACHSEAETKEGLAYRADIHHARGVSCADCHGGDPTLDDQDAAMNKAKGFVGVPKGSDIPKLCARCHGAAAGAFKSRYNLKDVASDFFAGAHGKALQGNDKGPTCVSCHGIHSIVDVKDPKSPVHPLHVPQTCGGCHGQAAYMRDFNPSLPVDQHEKYLTSVHGMRNAKGDAKTATCVSCHSNHAVLKVSDPRSPVYPTRVPGTCAHCHADAKYMAEYKIPTDQYDGYRKSAHGIALLKNSDLNAPACNSCHCNHGAGPPGATSVATVCGTCHQANAELFDKSVHRPVFDKAKLPGCVVCHSNHAVMPPTDALVGFEKPSPCAGCHHAGDTDSAAVSMRRMKGILDSLTAGRADAVTVLRRAEQLGMDVSDALYSLKDVNQSAVQTRVAIHAFRLKPFQEAAAPGLLAISSARQAGKAAVHEYSFRREGLVVSTLIVTVVGLLLYLKIRQIERRQKDEDQ